MLRQRKIWIGLLVFLFMVCFCFAACASESGQCGDNVFWTLDDQGVLTVSGTGAMYDYRYEGHETSPMAQNDLIKKIVVNEGVTTLGKRCFCKNDYLTEATLPESLTVIEEYAFYACDILAEIRIPGNVTYIGDSSFSQCYELKTVTIPASVQELHGRIFTLCKNLTSIDVDPANPNYVSVDGVLFNKSKTLLITYPAAKPGSSYTVPSRVKTINATAFGGNAYLEELILLPGVVNLDLQCFFECRNLASITLPKSLEHAWYGAFQGCSNLKDVYYGGSEEDRAKIIFESVDEPLQNAEWHYNVPEPEPDPIDITGAEIGDIADQVYSGKEIKPDVSVTFEGTELTRDTDFTVTYKNCKKVGKATVVVTGAGYYTGSVSKDFRIIPKAVKSPSVKAGSKKMTVKWKYDKKNDYDGYEIEYSLKKKFDSGVKTVTIKKAKTTSSVIKKLKKGKTYYVRIRTWKKVSGTKYYSNWSKTLKVKVK